MDLTTMRDRLRARVGNPDTTDVPAADLTRIINSAYFDLADRYRFHMVRKLCTFPTVASTQDYGLPSDLLEIIKVRDVTNGRQIKKTDYREDADKWIREDSTYESMPLHYLRYRNFIRLEPIPDDVYTIQLFYKAGVVALSDDTDEPVVPDTWHEGIIKLARHYFYDEKGDIPKSQYALSIYNSWLSTKPNEVDEEKKDLDKGVVIPTLQTGRRGFSQEAFDRE
jgi:hypothetical protein